MQDHRLRHAVPGRGAVFDAHMVSWSRHTTHGDHLGGLVYVAPWRLGLDVGPRTANGSGRQRPLDVLHGNDMAAAMVADNLGAVDTIASDHRRAQ